MDQQQNQIISLIAVFLALGIGILIGASTGEKALVMHQLAFIEELKGEILYYKEEIDAQFDSFLKLQQELSQWESLEEEYLNPLLLENTLKDVELTVVAQENVAKELAAFLQKSGCSYFTYLFKERSFEDLLLIFADTEIIILSGYADSTLASVLESLQNQGKFVIQVTDEENAVNISSSDVSFPTVDNINKFYNKIKLLKIIQEHIQEGRE